VVEQLKMKSDVLVSVWQTVNTRSTK